MASTATTSKRNFKKNQNPEAQFRFQLETCSKTNDLTTAISLYQSALSQNLHVTPYHYNALLHLCSTSVSNPALKSTAISFGFTVFDDMKSCKAVINEATVTAVARLAVAKGEGEYAFSLAKSLGEMGLVPKLRSYDPALLYFCENGEADRAYEVEEHMVSVGVRLEEQEFAALLRVSVETKRGARVYEYLHKLRSEIRCVRLDTAKIIEDWFHNNEVEGSENLDVKKVEQAIERNGGGWHGMGWMGKGKWEVKSGSVVDSEGGECKCCGLRLSCVDIDREETEKFADSVAALALDRETQASFKDYMEWLEEHADYEAVIDAANVGLYKQNFADGGFNVSQLNAVVKELYSRNKKWPLIVLHNKRLKGLRENPSSRKLLEEWMAQGVLYPTPHGSNDDWYWLYTAVKLKCLLVTNDEMRDHIFELLGRSFILRWKERHQVHYTFVKGNLKLHMPPPYSSVIQESKEGAWHVPIEADKSGHDESSRTWLCISRPNIHGHSSECAPGVEQSTAKLPEKYDDKVTQSCNFKLVACGDSLNCEHKSSEVSDGKMGSQTGKRKERSPSPQQPCRDNPRI